MLALNEGHHCVEGLLSAFRDDPSTVSDSADRGFNQIIVRVLRVVLIP